VSDLPSVVDVAWLAGELGAEDLFVGDVRGPNAHARGHIPGSKPLVLGSPPPMSDGETLKAYLQRIGAPIPFEETKNGETRTESRSTPVGRTAC